MKFRVLAVRIGQRSPYIKNLIPETLYQFYHDIEFTGEGKLKELAFRARENVAPSIYNVELDNGEILDIQISALLGKNGSGKSSLLEMLYLLIYCISERHKLLHGRLQAQRQIKRNSSRPFFEDQLRQIEEVLERSAIELCYELDGHYYLVENTAEDAFIYRLEGQRWIPEDFDPTYFFYTISVNYSLYGLNSGRNYFWLDSLFHKNDGYKTPLVINPFRNRGMININTELHLAQTRVLSNIIHEKYDSEELVSGKQIAGVNLTILPDQVGKFEISDIRGIYRVTLKEHQVDLVTVFSDLILASIKKYKAPLEPGDVEILADQLRIDLESPSNDTKEYNYDPSKGAPTSEQIHMLLAKYIIAKVYKICSRYDQFKTNFTKGYVMENTGQLQVPLIYKTDGIVRQLLKDTSHVTLKLRQAMHALMFGYFKTRHWQVSRQEDDWTKEQYAIFIDYAELKTMVRKARKGNARLRTNLAEFIPAAFVRPEIIVATGESGSSFGELSSGEQQMVHAIHGILYHLLNIESIKRTYHYRGVNIVLDEIELYYHPDFQRSFVKNLLDSFKLLNLHQIKGVNIIFSTHSPFILSDIFHTNVLKMIEGKPEKFQPEEKTFGANIHEMLSDSFFLESDLIGAHARFEILKVVRRLEVLRLKKELTGLKNNIPHEAKARRILTDQVRELAPQDLRRRFSTMRSTEKKFGNLKKFIALVGEPVVAAKLEEMYLDIFPEEVGSRSKVLAEIQQLMMTHQIGLEDLN